MIYVLGHIHKMNFQQTPSLGLVIIQAMAYRSGNSKVFFHYTTVILLTHTFDLFCSFDYISHCTRTVLTVKSFPQQLPTGRHLQSSAPSNPAGRRERSRSRSPHRSNRESHSCSSSSHRDDKKPRAASPQKERHHRQRPHVSK